MECLMENVPPAPPRAAMCSMRHALLLACTQRAWRDWCSSAEEHKRPQAPCSAGARRCWSCAQLGPCSVRA